MIDIIDDEQIVLLIRAGDQEKFSLLVKKYQNKLYRYTYYMLSNDELCKDVVQAAFIKAFININKFDAEKQFSSWLYRIAHNEAINVWRKEKNFSNLDDEQLAVISLPNKQEPEEILIESESRVALNLALSKLKFEQKEAIVLFYIEGYSYEQIAEIMNTSKNNIGSRILRAKKLLKEILIDEKN